MADLTSRLRSLQAKVRDEFESSGMDKLYEEKLNAAAVAYAEDQATLNASSSGYQSNDSAPDEAPEEPVYDTRELMYSQMSENLRAMRVFDECNRPWHEDLDETYEQPVSHADVPTPHYQYGSHNGVEDDSERHYQYDVCNNALDHRNDEQPAPIMTSARAPPTQPLAVPCPSDWQPRVSPTMASQNEYQLFGSQPTQTLISLHRQDQFQQVAEQPTSHYPHQRQWHDPAAKQPTTLTTQLAYQNRPRFVEPTPSSNSNAVNQNQWTPSAHVETYPGATNQVPWNQRSDGQLLSQIYYDAGHDRATQPSEITSWPNNMIGDAATAATTSSPPNVQPGQYETVVSVANALSNTMNAATGQTNLAAIYFSCSPTAGYDTVPEEYQNCLLKIGEQHRVPVANASSVNECANNATNVERYSSAYVLTGASTPPQQQHQHLQQSNQVQPQTFAVLEPPPLHELDLSKPPPPLPTQRTNVSPVNTFVFNRNNMTQAGYTHQQNDNIRLMQQQSPRTAPGRCDMAYEQSLTLQQVQKLSCARDLGYSQQPLSLQLQQHPCAPPSQSRAELCGQRAAETSYETIYGDAPQSEIRYTYVPLPPSPPQGAIAETRYSPLQPQHQNTLQTSYVQQSPFDEEAATVEQLARFAPFSSPVFETPVDEFSRQPPLSVQTRSPSPPPVTVVPAVRYAQPPAQTSRSMRSAGSPPTEVHSKFREHSSTATSALPASAQTTPSSLSGPSKKGTNEMQLRSSQRTSTGSSDGDGNGGLYTPPNRRMPKRHSGNGGSGSGGGRYSNGSAGYGNGGSGGGGRSMKRPSYTPEEAEQLAESLRESYGYKLDELLDRCFSKREAFRTTSLSLISVRNPLGEQDLFAHPRWTDESCSKLAVLKQRLNGVKERLSTYDLNQWHKHTRTTNPADLVMRRLRSDIKVEFLTQAWCKFYELVNTFNLVPRDARVSGVLRSVHLCEAPGAFVASLNHYLRLNYPKMKWYWKANSLNPYYEGNHLSSMINDDRFMLQTIRNWDFGPDMTGDIMHPQYPDHLRAACGEERLPHLVTSDGSFDCQDKPEEQERSVAWLHLKEALTALRILRKGGHFVIKMFTFFECESVCLLFLLQCVFQSIEVMKPATSKEGNSEVYVVCREFKDDPAYEPFIRRLLEIDEETHSKFAMFPFERIPRAFMHSVVDCAARFAKFQTEVIERNIRLFQHERYDEYRRHFEFVQEKLFERYAEEYRIKPIPLSETVVRLPPYRTTEKHFVSPKVIEQRERKQGSHTDQLKRSSLAKKDLVHVVMDEVANFSEHPLHHSISTVPKVDIRPRDVQVRCGKPIEMVTSSQFCQGMLIRVRNELIKVMGHVQYYITVSEMDKSVEFEDQKEEIEAKNLNLCDFTCSLARMKNYNDTQRELFHKLFDRLSVLQEGEALTLFCFPLLTQFNISVLCVLNQIFREITFEPPSTLYLRNLDSKNFQLWMPVLQDIGATYKGKAVISFLPIESITGSNNKFYSWVIEANNTQILREIDRVSQFHS